MIWNGQNSRKEGKWLSSLSATQFPPYILFKRRQGSRQFHPTKFIQLGARTNKYQNSFVARTIRDWNCLPNRSNSVIEKQSVEASKRSSCATFKNADAFFWLNTRNILYFYISTCASAHLPWWDIPFGDYTIRIRIRIWALECEISPRLTWPCRVCRVFRV